MKTIEEKMLKCRRGCVCPGNYSYAAWYVRSAGKLFLINFYDLKLYAASCDARHSSADSC